jgi:succinate dehydrogenase/fumarate reductase cytochrome b subunit
MVQQQHHAPECTAPALALLTWPNVLHALQGIDMLISEFGYHIAYKRWNDTFSAVPFKPK